MFFWYTILKSIKKQRKQKQPTHQLWLNIDLAVLATQKLRRRRRRPQMKKRPLAAAAEPSDAAARRLKEAFRSKMSHCIVEYLKPHNRNDCKQGRITNTQDFKFLARKVGLLYLAYIIL